MKHALICFKNALLLAFATGIQPSLLGQTATNTQKLAGSVPFVGCKSDGQTGPLNAPNNKSKIVSISAATAQRLAYYKAEESSGVLAPRGWYCFGIYGSNGASLFVSAHPINTTNLFSTTWEGFTGPVIQISNAAGDTSGRFEVASIIARIFPAHKAFVRKVIAEGIEPASNFPFGAYPNDKLTSKSKDRVEYQTPAQMDGLGTRTRLLKNAEPISGVEILVGGTPDLLSLAVRLPPDLSDLAPTIIQQVELEATVPQH